jgi:hypothetical protein
VFPDRNGFLCCLRGLEIPAKQIRVYKHRVDCPAFLQSGLHDHAKSLPDVAMAGYDILAEVACKDASWDLLMVSAFLEIVFLFEYLCDQRWPLNQHIPL